MFIKSNLNKVNLPKKVTDAVFLKRPPRIAYGLFIPIKLFFFLSLRLFQIKDFSNFYRY